MAKQSDNKLTVQDRLDIQELNARYAWGLDTADMDAFLGCFAPDGWWQTINGDRGQGPDAIRKLILPFFDRPNHAGTQHHINQILSAGDGERASSRSQFAMIRWDGDTGVKSVILVGWYEDRLVKRDGAWVFAERVIRNWNGKHIPWRGKAENAPR